MSHQDVTRWIFCLLIAWTWSVNLEAQSEAERLFQKARTMLEERQRDSAVYYAEEALTLTAPGDTLTGKLEHFVGYVLAIRYRYDEALPRLMRAIHILEPTGKYQDIVADCYLKAGRCERDPELKHALTSEAIQRFTQLNDSLNLAAACLNLGNLCFRQGQIEKFRLMGAQGLEWLGDSDRSDLRTRLNFAQGRYYNGTGNEEAALLFFERSYDELIASNPRDPFLFNLCKDYGLLLAKNGQPDKAIDVLRTPILPDTESKSPHRLSAEADIWFDLGMIYTDIGQFTQAEAAYNKSKECLQPYYGDQHVFTAYPHSELMNLYVQMGDVENARSSRDEALRILEGLPVYNHPDYARMSVRMATGLAGLNEPQKAIERIDAGLEAIGYTDTAGISLENVYRYDILMDLMNCKTELCSSNDLTGVERLAQYRSHIDLLDSLQVIQIGASTRITILEDHYHVFEKAMASLYDQYLLYGDVEVAREMLALSERSKDQLYTRFLIQNTLKTVYSIPDELIEQERSLNNRMAAVELELYKEGAPDSTAIAVAEAELKDLKFALLDVQNQINYPIDTRSIATSTGPGQTIPDPSVNLLHIFHGSDADYLIAHSRGTYNIKVLTDREDLALLSSQIHIPSDEWLQPAFSVYQDLAPILSGMDNRNSLLVVPDGNWTQIPFEALPTGPVGASGYPPMLISDFEISYASSLRSMKMTSDRSGTVKNLAAYAPTYEAIAEIRDDTTGSELYAQLVRSGEYNLPGAGREAQIVATTIGGSRFSGQEATEQHFRENAADYQVLHLSMHALLEDDNPNYSRLLFTRDNDPEYDGYLFASELSQMQLNAELAVLSACNTGRGKNIKGEGVMSLSRAFNYAGVPSVVHSLWKVPDDATADIMPEFYNELKRGERKSEALRNAKLAYLQNTMAPELRHPYYWAGFVTNGNTSPVKFKSNSWLHYLIIGSIVLAVLFILGSRSSKQRRQAV